VTAGASAQVANFSFTGPFRELNCHTSYEFCHTVDVSVPCVVFP